MRFCKCGQMYRKQCPRCGDPHTGTTAQRGYDNEHTRASRAYRAEHPLCEACVMVSVLTANEATSMHHIQKITARPDLRMVRANWLAVCPECHERLETDVQAGQAVKRWSVDNYREAMSGDACVGG